MIGSMLTRYSEYNPPDFIIEAYKHALDEIEGNQYAPVTVNIFSRKNEKQKQQSNINFSTVGYGLPQGGSVFNVFSHLL